MKVRYYGKIRKECITSVDMALILGSTIVFILGSFFLILSLTYEKIEPAARILMYIVTGLCYFFSIFFPLITLKLIKIYPKHQKIAYLFLKPYIFNDDEPYPTMEDLSKGEIIELMYNKPIQQEYIKTYYSQDKMKRLIIFQNNANSYSYEMEQLTIVEPEEREVYGCYAYWEPNYPNKNVSFYETLDLLLEDISVEIKGWQEK